MIMDFSLQFPEGKQPCFQTLTEETCNDLSLDYICERITDSDYEQTLIRKMMTKLESDPEVIRYRRDIFDDMLSFPSLRDKIKDLLEQLYYLKELEKSVRDQTAAPVWQLINRLQELHVYVNCIAGINDCLTENAIQSSGLKKLKDYVNSVYSESGFEYLREDINEMMMEVSRIKSVSLGVNLDDHMRPCEVGIVSLNDKPFNRPGFLGKFLSFATKKSEVHSGTSFEGMTKIYTVGKVAGEDPLMGGLNRVIEEMLDSTVRHLKNRLSKYVNISGYSLTKLIPDFIFYMRWAEFFEKLKGTGLPLCKPEIEASDDRRTKISDLYNMKLAVQLLQGKKLDMIVNDIEFSPDHGIYILTGPNRGGKTTFTQAVGLIFLLSQHGLYVPAKSATICPADNIFTHFPADENRTVNLGRLGEESKRLSEIFTMSSNKSLLLLNESLATTSFAEGLYIAKDVVKALRFLGARTIFNTHMHELATDLQATNAMPGDIKVASLITGIHEGKRSYKVFLAPPEGVSYARDIAEKYGVTYDQLIESAKKEPPRGGEEAEGTAKARKK